MISRGRLVRGDGEADDLAVLDREITGHDELVGQVRFVVGSVLLGADGDLAVVVDTGM